MKKELQPNTAKRTKPQLNLSKKAFNSMTMAEQAMRNKPVFIGLILLSAVLFFVMLGFNALAGNPDLVKYGPFHHTIGNVSSHYPLNITPAGWAFSIWGLIYLFQFGGVAYSLLLLCRKSDGQPAYNNPVVLSPLYFVLFILGCLLNVGWLFQWDRLMFNASLVFLASQSLVLFSALSIVSTRLVFYTNDLIDAGRKIDITILRVVIINGLGMYATWSTVATLINIGVAAVYRWNGIDGWMEMISNFCLFALMGLLAAYFFLDLTVFFRYTKHTYSPYLTITWAAAAIIAKNWNPENWSSINAAFILGLSSVLFVFKLVFTYRYAQRLENSYRRLKNGGGDSLKLNVNEK